MRQETCISTRRVVASQVTAVAVKNLLTVSIGMSFAHATIMIPALVNDPMFLITKEEASWIGSISFVTLFLGGALSGFRTQKLGRKTCMQFAAIPLIACWMTLKFCTRVWQIFASIVVMGSTFGLIEAPITSYVAEITQPNIRGLLASLNPATVTTGLIVEFALGTILSWRNAAAVSGVVPIIACLLLFFIPESPHWLIMHKRLSDAQKSLAWLRGWTTTEFVKSEFEEMCHNHLVELEATQQNNTKKRLRGIRVYFKKSFCCPLSIMFLICCIAGFSGCLNLQTYAVNVFATFQVPINQYCASLMLTISHLLGFIVYIILLRSQGQRLLIFTSLCGCAITMCALGFYAYVHDIKYIMFQNANTIVQNTEIINWLPLILILLLAFFYNLGIRSVVVLKPYGSECCVMYQETCISTRKIVASQVTAVAVKNLLTLSIGMNFAQAAVMIPALVNEPMFLITKEEASWIGSVGSITLLLGGALSGFFTQKLGRKTCMQLSAIPLIACWMTFKFCTRVWQIFASIVVMGSTFGLIEAPVTSYVAEVTQPHIRGLLASLSPAAVTAGLILEFALGSFLSWRNAAAVSGVVPMIACLLLFFIPESPHWLIMHKRLSDAQKSLAWLRGWTTTEFVKSEFEEMCHNHQEELEAAQQNDTKKKLRGIRIYFQKSFYWPLSIMFLICCVAAFSGCWNLQTYAVNVFATFEVPINQYYASLALTISQLLGFIVYIILLRSLGKRLLIFTSLCGCAIIMCALGFYAYIRDIKYVMFQNANTIVQNTENLNWLPLILLLLMGLFYNIGIRSVVWVIMGEIFSHGTRAIGCGFMCATFSGCSFLSNKTFWAITDYLTFPVLLWIYSLINLIGFLVLYFTLPETEGKTLDEISNHFAGISKLDNKVNIRV
ncbi:hypothetical protein FQR65_LT02387 [Abscondita terminalis]|nr:hypothetical protein FQR65_LT02387 [Abscondita terminalis]